MRIDVVSNKFAAQTTLRSPPGRSRSVSTQAFRPKRPRHVSAPDEQKTDWKPYIGSAISVATILYAQGQMSGAIRAELNALNTRLDQVDKKVERNSQQLVEVKEGLSFLKGYIARDEKMRVPAADPAPPPASVPAEGAGYSKS